MFASLRPMPLSVHPDLALHLNAQELMPRVGCISENPSGLTRRMGDAGGRAPRVEAGQRQGEETMRPQPGGGGVQKDGGVFF